MNELMDKYIYYFSGPVQSGKTTKISLWMEKFNCAGILAPIINNARHLRVVSSGELKNLEDISTADSNVVIGRYCFSDDVFRWGRESLYSEFELKPDWLIIDEYGKLEMIDKGLEPSISEIIKLWKPKRECNLLIVVRDYLVDSFINKFYDLKNSIKEFELDE
jgi:nucleoside-triphosphatase THEP1